MTDEKEKSLKLWLSRHRPDYVRCTLHDNSVKELARPQVGRGQWVQMERMIEQLEPRCIELLRGEKRELIIQRVFDVDVEEEEPEAASVPGQMTIEAAIAASINATVGAFIKILPTLTQLIVDAGDASAQRHAEAYGMAFQKNNELVKMTTDMTSQMAKGWMQMLFDQQALAQQQQSDPNDATAMGIINGVLSNRGANGANGAHGAGTETKKGD